jgi:hypothetical protein
VAVEAGGEAVPCRSGNAPDFLAFTRERDEGSEGTAGESALVDLAGLLGDVERCPPVEAMSPSGRPVFASGRTCTRGVAAATDAVASNKLPARTKPRMNRSRSAVLS